MARGTPEAPADDRFLRRKGVADLLGVSRHTLRRLIERDATFPRFIRISAGIEVVRKRAVLHWLSGKELDTLNAHAAARLSKS
jgi:predicted DNA-binding transcriptional regulator AlpA